MCLGIPMQVESCQAQLAQCHYRGELQTVDLSLVGPVAAGDWLLVFSDAAREILAPQQARDILEALEALEAVMNGHYDPAHYLVELNQREPQLPPHLQAQFDQQRTLE